MRKRFRFSVGSLLTMTALVALILALVVQQWRHHAAESRREVEIASLRDRLHAMQQMLGELPVDDPRRACALAMPPYAYARWACRVSERFQ